MSTVDASSWHYRLVAEIFGKRFKQASHKACAYYWIWLSLTLIWISISSIIMIVVSVFGWLLGYHITFSDKTTDDLFYPHKQKQDGTKSKAQPWQILLPVFLISVGYWLMSRHLEQITPTAQTVTLILTWAAIMGSVIVGLILLGYLIERYKGRLGKAWNWACPTLIVVNNKD